MLNQKWKTIQFLCFLAIMHVEDVIHLLLLGSIDFTAIIVNLVFVAAVLARFMFTFSLKCLFIIPYVDYDN